MHVRRGPLQIILGTRISRHRRLFTDYFPNYNEVVSSKSGTRVPY